MGGIKIVDFWAIPLFSEPINIEELKLQEEEVQEVCWMDFETCCEKVKSGDKKYCLFPEELKMIKEYLKIWFLEIADEKQKFI